MSGIMGARGRVRFPPGARIQVKNGTLIVYDGPAEFVDIIGIAKPSEAAAIVTPEEVSLQEPGLPGQSNEEGDENDGNAKKHDA